MSVNNEAHGQTAEAILRAYRPSLLIRLQRKFAHLELAEDCLQEACLRAIENWSQQGIPDKPAAWLWRVAENLCLDGIRKNNTIQAHRNSLQSPDVDQALPVLSYKDDFLRLLHTCCHPELNPQDQIALALKVVCGFSVASIARALLVQEKTMEKRITRAKRKASETASHEDFLLKTDKRARLPRVCSLLYLMFNEGYSTTNQEQLIAESLCSEAIRLCRLLLTHFPSDPELQGLLALLLFQHARRKARADEQGWLLTLEQQDRGLWDKALIQQGLIYLSKSQRLAPQSGPYQLQSALAAQHCLAPSAAQTDWAKILQIYDALLLIQPTSIVRLNRAVAIYKTLGIETALNALEEVAESLKHYMHFYTTKAGMLFESGRMESAAELYRIALTLGPGRQEKAFITKRLEEIRLII